MDKNNLICICGHLQLSHDLTHSFVHPVICCDCYRSNYKLSPAGKNDMFPYHLFKVDNLRYLEMMSYGK